MRLSNIFSPGIVLAAAFGLCGCTFTQTDELSALRDRPSLPYSVFVTGGAFVTAGDSSAGPLARTYDLAGTEPEAFALDRLHTALNEARVFVWTRRDDAPPAVRRVVAEVPQDQDVDPIRPELRQTLDRARRTGHDFLLVVEEILDGPVESRGVNDRWPFTVGAWLFALGALIPDRTYESLAILRVSLVDVYTGHRVKDLLVEPEEVDLNMIERCGFWGFVQSVLVPPFWTSTDPESIVESVRKVSTQRLLVRLMRRLKSLEVDQVLRNSGPAQISLAPEPGGWRIKVAAKEALSAVALRLDGDSSALDDGFVTKFEKQLLDSQQKDAALYRYDAVCRLPRSGRLLQVLVQTQAARISSVTWTLGGR